MIEKIDLVGVSEVYVVVVGEVGRVPSRMV